MENINKSNDDNSDLQKNLRKNNLKKTKQYEFYIIKILKSHNHINQYYGITSWNLLRLHCCWCYNFGSSYRLLRYK